uniref:MerC domain-containing protein n=1 Tax=Ningiella ruwaisensis TaxID=2364274 RepID=UPI001F4FEF7F|nr:MerC domain-containing protein [Ningiella ruwaisensis]
MKKLLDSSDKTAVALSFVCVLHCIALPLVLLALPSISGLLVLDDERFHLWLVFIVIPISIFALISGFLHHKRTSVFFVSALGMLMLIAAALFGHDYLGEKGEVGLTLFGSILIAVGHLRNLRLRRVRVCRNLSEPSL